MTEKQYTKRFLEQYDLGWNEDCYIIAKKTAEDVLRAEVKE